MRERLSAYASRRRNGWIGIVIPGVYAALVLVAAVAVTAVLVFSDDPGFVGIWLFIPTLPLSILPLALLPTDSPGPLGTALVIAATAGAGLVQAWLLHLLLRGRRVRD
ncbi:SCO4225 family membrane protein [Spirillospora sp. NPDC050679]